MIAIGKPASGKSTSESCCAPSSGSAPGTPDAGEITARDLLDVLAKAPAKKLVFIYDGETIRPGYHITEVKTGQFKALDCGAQFEAWTETFIQLWDVEEGDRTHMTAGKFAAIIDKVEKLSSFDAGTKLTFEVSDGVQAMRLFRADAMDTDDTRITVTLARRPASCKPRDRWLAEEQASAASCCGPATQAQACCAA
jgi:hypothetical protein